MPISSTPARNSSSFDHEAVTMTPSSRRAGSPMEENTASMIERFEAGSPDGSARAARNWKEVPRTRPAASRCSPVASVASSPSTASAARDVESASLVAEPITYLP
jgi:hypothetical protein